MVNAPPTQHIRYTIVGTAPDGEVFNTSVWSNPSQAITNQALLQDSVDSFVDQFVTDLLPTVRSMVRNDTVYTHVRAYYYSGGTQAEFQAEGNIATADGTGTSTDGVMPLQGCLVASLHTHRPGRSYRGRMYWPATGLALGTAGHYVPNPNCDVLATAMATFFNNQVATSDDRFVVASQKLSTSQRISEVTVDNRLDIQRRRANRQLATHVATADVTTDN